MLQLALLLLFAGPAVPPPSDDIYLPLFVIERSTNANVVHYDARVTKAGGLNPQEPVVAYWIMLSANGRRENLNSIEKSKSYGFTIAKDVSGDSFRMYVSAQRGKEIQISMVGGLPRAETRIGGRNAYLQKVYISTGKIDIFHVNYIELFGVDAATGESCHERNPDR